MTRASTTARLSDYRAAMRVGAILRSLERAGVSVPLFALLLGVYAFFYQAGGWNQNSRFDLVRAIVEDHALTIDRFEKNTGDDAVRDGHYYCDKAPGASLLAVPAHAALFALAGSPRPIPEPLLALCAWLSIVFAVSVPSALGASFLFRAARAMGLGEGIGLVTALGWALGSMALPYATLLYGNQLAASLMIAAFALLVEGKHGEQALTTSRLLVVFALLGLAVATEYPAALIGIPIGLYALHVVGLRRAAIGALGAALPLAVLFAYHRAAFGRALAFPYDFSVWQEPKTGWFMGLGKPDLGVLHDLLLGEFRGLFWATPWLALAVPGAIAAWPTRAREVAVCAAAVLAFLWLNASLPPRAWHGGWAAGPRYLVPMLPFAALLAGAAIHAVAPRRALLAGVVGLLLVSGANMLVVTAVKPEVPTSERKPFTGYAWPHFLAGDLAVSRQSIDMLTDPPGGPKQAFNVGMKLGLTGLASLGPLAAWTLACGVWLARAQRRATRPASD